MVDSKNGLRMGRAVGKPNGSRHAGGMNSVPMRVQIFLRASCLFLFVFLSACAVSTQGQHPVGAGIPGKVIYVVSHGWHTAIVLKREEIPDTIVWPELRDFAASQYIEIGWGDWEFYQAPEATWAMTLKAAFWPTRSVLHVAGFSEPVRKFFPANEVIEVVLTDEGFKELCRFIARTHMRVERDQGIKIGPGLYGNSGFYPAEGKFHVFRNCNSWVAQALRVAGLPVSRFTITAGSVMAQVRAFARDFRDTREGSKR